MDTHCFYQPNIEERRVLFRTDGIKKHDSTTTELQTKVFTGGEENRGIQNREKKAKSKAELGQYNKGLGQETCWHAHRKLKRRTGQD